MHNIGAVFPQTEIGNDISAIRDYIQAVEGMGYSHLLAYDHVLGAGLSTRPNWTGPYTSDTPFHEVFTLFSYAAALTTKLGFVTGVLILPQRQTALVAKQAAQIDLFSGGRFRLGVGIGWNKVEYDGLKEDFSVRGKRSEEQIALLRQLWTQDVVTFNGQYDQIDNAGINPLPIQRPIPIWIGGEAEVVLKRTARIGDGWFPQSRPDADARQQLEWLQEGIAEAGRNPEEVGIEPRLTPSRIPQAEWGKDVEKWQAMGATHMSINTMGAGYKTPQDHINALQAFRTELGDQFGA
jgi:probable F420-dependent oxidoreductase